MRSTQENVGPENVDFEGAVQTDRSLAGRFGLSDSDALIVALGALYVVAFGPFFHSFLWTPRVILLLGALPFGLYELAQLVRRRDRPAIAGTLLIGWALFVGLVSDAPISSIFIVNGRWDSVLWLSAALGMWALGRRLSPRGRVVLGMAFLGACAASGLVGLLQATFDITYEPLVAQGRRASGFGVNPVYFGATMAGAAGFCIRTYISGDRGWRSRWALAGVAIGVLLVTLSGSRVALASCLVLIVVGIAIARSGRALLLIPAAACGVLVATLLQRRGGNAESSAADRLTAGGIWPRARIWSYGWRAFLDRPITGYGLGRFRPATQRFFSPEFVRREATDDLLQAWYDAHNVVAQVTVSLGVVGLALFAWFVVSAARRSHGPLLWATSAIAICWMLEPPSHVTYGLAALLLGASQLDRGEDTGVDEPARMSRSMTVAACVAAALLSGWAIVSDLTLKVAYESGSVEDARRAVLWNPLDATVMQTVSTAVLDPAHYDDEIAAEVLDWSERATELEPGLPFMWAQLGIRQVLFGDVDGGRASLEHAIELEPYHPLALAVLRNLAEREGDGDLLALVEGRLREIETDGVDVSDGGLDD
jgi:O-antigen ligase